MAVSDHPEGPFRLISQYQVPDSEEKDLQEGIFIDPGVLVDDDGKVYIYCGYIHSFMAQINPSNMYEVLDGSYQRDINIFSELVSNDANSEKILNLKTK